MVLRNLKVGVRLGLGFGVMGLLLVVIVAIGLWSQSIQAAAAQQVADGGTIQRDAEIAKFQTADFAGWQSGYAFDYLRNLPGALDDTVGQRKAFLQSTAAFGPELAKLRGYSLTPDEAALVDAAQRAFDEFMRVDGQIIAGYRGGTRAGIAQANDLAEGASPAAMQKIVDAINSLVEKANAADEKDLAGAAAANDRIRTLVLVVGAVCLLLAAGLAVVVTRTITRPLSQVVAAIQGVARKDLTTRADLDSRDELGEMARALDDTVQIIRDAFASVSDSSKVLAAATEELNQVSSQIETTAGETSQESGRVAVASEQVSSNVQSVAAGTEEMTAAIGEIAGSASEAAAVARHGVDSAQQASETVTRLGESSTEIGNVVNLITSIAEQTNLLALNATIEAARAGESGKGFAVVAGEVKDLAQATAKATDDISRRVEAIQRDTVAAVDAIADINSIITRISEYSTTIAAAVEEQTATTQEMSRGVSEAATGSGDIANGIQRVAAGAQHTSASVADARRTAADLARVSNDLHALVGQFQL